MNTRSQRIRCIAMALLISASAAAAQTSSTILEGYEPSFGQLRDTVFVLDSTFLEVRLNEQKIYQHFRSGRVLTYTCSTGDPRIEDGIATREGIYSIQWKSKKHMSQQFQVYLNYWMPFDGGIGFHGLQGRSYYRYLGRRPSSHGCVRIANETGAKIFRDAPRGTAVWVHGGSPARLLRFADSSTAGLVVMDAIDTRALGDRMNAVIDCRPSDSSLTGRLALRPGKPFVGRIPVGRVDRRSSFQRDLPLARTARPVLTKQRAKPTEPREIRVTKGSEGDGSGV